MSPPTERLEILLGEWERWQLAVRSQPRSITERRNAIIRMARVCDPETATTDDVVRWLSASPWAPNTARTQYSYAKGWFGFLLRTQRRTDNPMVAIPPPYVPRAVPRPVTSEEIARLLRSGCRRKTRMMILLAMYQGLRVHEVAKFRGQDIHGAEMIVSGKGGVIATLPLHPEVAKYASWFPETFPGTGWWFPSPKGGHTSAKSVSNLIAEGFKRAGIHASAHQLRHWYGTQVLKAAGGNLRVAQELLRHSSPQTTAIYTQVDDTQRRAAVVALPRVA